MTDTMHEKLGRSRNLGLALGLIGLLSLAGMYFQNKQATMQAYLFGWFFWTMVTIGCFGLTALHHTLRGKWGLSILRLVEAGGSPFSLLMAGLAGIPILTHLGLLYPWANPTRVAEDTILQGKLWYLTDTMFITRYVLYFAIFIILSYLLQQSSRLQDRTLDESLAVKRNSLGPVTMIVIFILMTFSVTDWIMSLEPHWFSSILPVLTVVGGALTALSLCVIVILANKDEEPYKQIITPELTKDLGNLLFALTMLWQYMTLSQYLITYSGNLSEEAPYYIKRNLGGWEWLITITILLQFFLPFMCLLAPRVKRFAKNLIAVAILIFAVRFLDIYWTVMPSMRSDTKIEKAQGLLTSLGTIQDYVALIAFAGVFLFAFGREIAAASVLPKHDTRLLEVEHAH